MGATSHMQADKPPPAFLRRLDNKSKWLVTFAQTGAIIARRQVDLAGPLIVIGAIGATVLASGMKRAVNQKRPAGSPFSDPGMPSSHALTSMFLATAWAVHVGFNALTAVILCAAVGVGALRVLCGHHTPAQVLVGGVLGCVMSCCWMQYGAKYLILSSSFTSVAGIYGFYLVCSIMFVKLQLSKRKIGHRSKN